VVVAQTISHYGLWISIGLIVVIVFFQVRSQRHLLRTASQARTASEASTASQASTAEDEDAPAAS
jgi:beta-lactamase regulating signal transducer with metallopeptidase domain